MFNSHATSLRSKTEYDVKVVSCEKMPEEEWI